jgi:O-antigen/teichoic acid export membrane protein
MVNGIIAVTVNLTLNALLIPRYGILGAATASSIAISLWPLMRLIEVWWLLKCWPFTLRTALIAGSAIAGGLGVHTLTLGQGLGLRTAATVGLVAVWAAMIWMFGRTPEDKVVTDIIRDRVAKLRR